mgnify:CR=1 FL=1
MHMKLTLHGSKLKSKGIKMACALHAMAVLLPSESRAADSERNMLNAATTSVAAKWENLKGTIRDSRGEPLVGVSVKVKGTTAGTVTDENGAFRIDLPTGNETLIVSYIGFIQQEVEVGGKTTLSVVLQENLSNLDEVVVTGYGTQKKSEILGAVSTIKGEELEGLPVVNLSEALRDRVAGLSVNSTGAYGAGISLNIRNSKVSETSSGLGATTEPLYIIDGLVVGKSEFDLLDATQVEEISVLKDASAAIYGASGAKGVIVVKTRRGKAGKIRLSYSGFLGVTDASRTPEMLSAYEHAKLLNETYDAEGDVSFIEYFSEADLELLKGYNYESWYDQLWKPEIRQKHNVNISGGSEKVTFFAGGNFQKQTGNYADISRSQYGFRSGMTANITDDLKADLSFNLNYSGNSNAVKLDYQSLITTPQWVPLTINGIPVKNPGQNLRNPLAVNNSGAYDRSNSTAYRINGSLSYSPKFIPGLTARLQVGQNGDSQESRKYTAPYQEYNFNRVGNNLQLYGDSIISIVDVVDWEGARLGAGYGKSSGYQGNFVLNYAKTLAKHSFAATAGGELTEGRSSGLGVYWDSQLISGSDEFWAFDLSKFTRERFEGSESIKQSFFARASYNFDEKYYIDGIIRADASTSFAVNNIWGYSPSIGLGWAISKEKFFKDNIKFINYLKLKANFGITGDDRIESRLWQERYKIDFVNTGYIYGETMVSTLNPAIIPNPDITWEKARSINIGFDMSLLDNHMSFAVDYFHRYTYDQFDKSNNENFPMFAGFIAPVINHYETHTYGTEFTIGYRGGIKKELQINASMNFGFGNGYVSQTFYNPYRLFENTYPDFQNTFGLNPAIWEGSNLGLISKGIIRSQAEVDAILKENPNYTIFEEMPEVGFLDYVDQNGDGLIDERDYVPMYKNGTNPLTVVGTTLGLTYKSFALRTTIRANIGGKVFYDSDARRVPTETVNVANIWKDRWSPTNPDGKFPRADDPSYKSENSTFWAVDGTMIRINNMSLSYSLPAPLAKKIGMSKASLLLTGDNLWTLVNPLPYKDPYAGNMYGSPTLTTYSLGLNVGF